LIVIFEFNPFHHTPSMPIYFAPRTAQPIVSKLIASTPASRRLCRSPALGEPFGARVPVSGLKPSLKAAMNRWHASFFDMRERAPLALQQFSPAMHR
jgi:hypothetical protein